MRDYRSSNIRLSENLNAPASFWKAPKLELEIGCGVGLHPLTRSLQNPDLHLIAIEHTKEKYDSFYRRYLNHKSPQNLWPVHANAITWVDNFVAEESLDRIFLLYPNPNPKRASQRWVRMPFFAKLISSLKIDGEIVLATNIPSYAEEAEDWMKNHWGLELRAKRDLRKVLALGRTHFERKYLARGEDCTELVFAKKRRP